MYLPTKEIVARVNNTLTQHKSDHFTVSGSRLQQESGNLG